MIEGDSFPVIILYYIRKNIFTLGIGAGIHVGNEADGACVWHIAGQKCRHIAIGINGYSVQADCFTFLRKKGGKGKLALCAGKGFGCFIGSGVVLDVC